MDAEDQAKDRYNEILAEAEKLNCDCDYETAVTLSGIIVEYPITQEQVEVLWALSKDVAVVRRAAYDLYFVDFPDDDLAELTEWVRRCKDPKFASWGYTAKQAAEAMRALGKAGIAAAMAGHKLQQLMEEINDVTTKNKQNHGPTRVRKKHVFKATDNTRMRPVLSKPHRSSHVYQRRG